MQAKRVDTLSSDSPFARAMSAIERHMMVVDTRSSAINAGNPNAPPAAPLRAAATLCHRGYASSEWLSMVSNAPFMANINASLVRSEEHTSELQSLAYLLSHSLFL